jgi:hypothetical protein
LRIITRLLLTLVSLCITSISVAQSYMHEDTRTLLPKNVLDFTFLEAVDRDKISPGFGTAIRYSHPGYWVTLFISKHNPSVVAESFESPQFKQYANEVNEALLILAKSRDPKARATMKLNIPVKTGDITTQVQFNLYTVYVDGTATNDFNYVWLSKNQYWQLRLTRIPSQMPDTPTAFVETIMNASVIESKQDVSLK